MDRNIGSLVNKGWEFAVNGEIISTENLSWN
jgi:hypothetical protein